MSSTQRHSSVLQSLLQSGLTPARLTFSHLIITGIPVLWGIKPLWDSSLHSWMGAKVFNRFSPATSMFNDRILTEGRFASSMEASAVHDMGWLFIYPYELSLVAWFILRNSQQAMEHFHDALALCSFATVLFLSLLQGIHPKWSLAPLEPDFFARMVLCHMVAVSVSAVSIALRKSNPVLSEWQQDWRAKSARWSIPGMALLSGAVSFLCMTTRVSSSRVSHDAVCVRLPSDSRLSPVCFL